MYSVVEETPYRTFHVQDFESRHDARQYMKALAREKNKRLEREYGDVFPHRFAPAGPDTWRERQNAIRVVRPQASGLPPEDDDDEDLTCVVCGGEMGPSDDWYRCMDCGTC